MESSYQYKRMRLFERLFLLTIIIISSPLILAIGIVHVLTNGFAKKCKYYKICPLYSNQNKTCTDDAGEYYISASEARLAGCARRMEELHGNNKRS